MAIELKFTVGDDGNVSVNGPIKDVPLCLDIIGAGLRAIAQFNKKEAPMIQPARLVPLTRNGP